MREYIKERILEEARYIVESEATVRQAAKTFASSKSTVHKDVTERLREIDKELFEEVRKVLEFNLSERHIRRNGDKTKVSERKKRRRLKIRRFLLYKCRSLCRY